MFKQILSEYYKKFMVYGIYRQHPVQIRKFRVECCFEIEIGHTVNRIQ